MAETTALALQQRDSRALEPACFAEAYQAAKVLHESNFFPESCRTPQAALVIITKGRELGLPMMQAVSEICLVKGKVQLSASLMAALVLRSGAAEYFSCVESSASLATYVTKRVGDPTGEKRLSYSIEEARAAGLVRKSERGLSAWEAHPADMLRARAISKLARMVYPDVLTGCYTPDEMADFDRERRERAPAAERPAQEERVQEVVQAQVVTPPAAAALPSAAEEKPKKTKLERFVDKLAECTSREEVTAALATMNEWVEKQPESEARSQFALALSKAAGERAAELDPAPALGNSDLERQRDRAETTETWT